MHRSSYADYTAGTHPCKLSHCFKWQRTSIHSTDTCPVPLSSHCPSAVSLYTFTLCMFYDLRIPGISYYCSSLVVKLPSCGCDCSSSCCGGYDTAAGVARNTGGVISLSAAENAEACRHCEAWSDTLCVVPTVAALLERSRFRAERHPSCQTLQCSS